jgi:hypothetical protein
MSSQRSVGDFSVSWASINEAVRTRSDLVAVNAEPELKQHSRIL